MHDSYCDSRFGTVPASVYLVPVYLARVRAAIAAGDVHAAYRAAYWLTSYATR